MALRRPEVVALKSVAEQVNPADWLKKQIQVDNAGQIFRISMSGNNPHELQVLVNAVTEAYLQEVVEAGPTSDSPASTSSRRSTTSIRTTFGANGRHPGSWRRRLAEGQGYLSLQHRLACEQVR